MLTGLNHKKMILVTDLHKIQSTGWLTLGVNGVLVLQL